MVKNCLNPKCNKEFTPKNKKGVYCSGNCRAAHAYIMKSKGMSKERRKRYVDYMGTYKGTPNLNEYMASCEVIDGIKKVDGEKLFKALEADGFKMIFDPSTKQPFNTEPIKGETIEVSQDRTFPSNNTGEDILKQQRISELEKELKNPPKTANIGVKNWIRVREQELQKLKSSI